MIPCGRKTATKSVALRADTDIVRSRKLPGQKTDRERKRQTAGKERTSQKRQNKAGEKRSVWCGGSMSYSRHNVQTGSDRH